jgi:hypothetical protein
MVKSDNIAHKKSSLKCINTISNQRPDSCWQPICNHGGIDILMQQLKEDNDTYLMLVISILCNISSHMEVRLQLSRGDSLLCLAGLLARPIDDIRAKAAILLSDLASIASNQNFVVDSGAIRFVASVLESDKEHVLVHSVNFVRVLALHNARSQELIAEHHIIEKLVEFLSFNSEMLMTGPYFMGYTWTP